MSINDFRDFFVAASISGVLVGAAVLGMHVRPRLAPHHRADDTVQVLQAVFTMLVTFAAIVLGLLTTTAKSSFDEVGLDVQRYATRLIEIDRLLREFGPQSSNIRKTLSLYTERATQTAWGQLHDSETATYELNQMFATPVGSRSEGALLDDIESQIRALKPQGPEQSRLQTSSIASFMELVRLRWSLIESANAPVDTPFYLVLVLWLVVTFSAFGLSAPRNLLVYLAMFFSAIAIGSAIFVILDMRTPFGGLIAVSKVPLHDAFLHLRAVSSQ